MRRAVFGFPVLSLLAAGTAVANPQGSLAPRIELDHPAVLAQAPGAVYLLIDFDVPRAEATAKRPPLNLALVIDRSGSMDEKGKIEYAHQAAYKVIDALAPSDRLAVIAYDDKVDVVWPSRPVESPDVVKKMIAGLTPRGSTNLAGGLVRGADEITPHVRPDAVSRVVLLTDGLANHGVTEPSAIAKLVRAAKARGVKITSMGLGADYNEDLLQAIAENGGGQYYFIEHPNQMARIFAEELSVMYASVAKNVSIKVDAGDRVKRAEVFGYEAATSGKRTTIDQADLYAGEKRSVLVRLELEPGAEGTFRAGTVLIEYLDLADNQRKSIERELTLEATARPERVAERTNPRVTAESTLITAEKEYVEQVKAYERGDEDGAKARLADLEQRLRSANSSLKDVRIAKKIEGLQMEASRMDRAKASAAARSIYLKKGKLSGTRALKGKRGTYILEEGASGYEVERLQKALADLGFYKGPINGRFDANLKAAVEAFQAQQKLDSDGVAGPATLDRLDLY